MWYSGVVDTKMGAEKFEIDGGLYGFKGDLKERLSEGDVPRWLYPDTPRTTGDDRLDKSADPSEFFEACVEAARGENERYSYHDRDYARATFRVFFSDSTRLSGPSGSLQMNKPTLAPQKIRERIREWIDENEDDIYRRNAYAEFRRGPRVEVSLGRRGGVNDVRLVMEYGN